MTNLNISEHFFSIQGEGKTMGIPSIFLRLQACNLLCNWKINGVDHYCDTLEVWKKGSPYTPEQLLKVFEYEGYLSQLQNNAHLILTGGEPTLQQDAFVEFYRLLPFIIYTEIETNGTILMKKEFYNIIDQINCSPKLNNSNIPKERRYKPEVLSQIAISPKSIFKFVINKQEDITEILNDFINPFRIHNHKVWLMPECSTRDELHNKQTMVVELCKKYGFNFSDRLQVSIWNKCTGV